MAGKPQDLRGKRYGKLTVLKDVGRMLPIFEDFWRV